MSGHDQSEYDIFRAVYFNCTSPSDGITHVEINRPAKMNAFIEEMWLELRTIFEHLSTSPTTRVIILSGAGPRAFTTGLDTTAASSPPSPLSLPSTSPSSDRPLDAARTATHLRRHITTFQACISAVEKCEKPVIAALHGYCLGLGIDLSLCCDVRICAADTRFAVKEVDIGIAADIGTLTRLPKVVGHGSWVKDVCLSGRGFGAAEAERAGFVSWVGESGSRGEKAKEEVLGEAVRWAKVVGGKSPVAVQGTKEILNWSWDRSVEDGLRYTAVWNSAMLQSRDVKEAMTAGKQRKTPTFSKL